MQRTRVRAPFKRKSDPLVGFLSTRTTSVRRTIKGCYYELGHSFACMAARRLVALDFDGVVCDSVGESSISGIKAAALQWPDIFDTPEAVAKTPELLENMRAVRPVVETGYENVVQVRCLYEGENVDNILQNWHELLPHYMNKWSLKRAELVEIFASVRDDWMKNDLDGWLAPNKVYDGVAEAISPAMQKDDVYIVTTKQAHYTEMLLERLANLSFPSHHIFSQTVSGQPKSEVLTNLQDRHNGAAARIFVEDKLLTLEKVCKVAELDSWRLLLVDWGYNTEQERDRARSNPRIEVVNISEFQKLMQS